jgi:hypothetical protein
MAHPVPPSIDQLGDRPFSFYPAVIGVVHNEWTFRRATWSETLVRNRTTDQEIWIPRRFIGEVSKIDEPVVIVGLNKELELKGGMLVPHERRVIELPRSSVLDKPRAPDAPSEPKPASVVGIRLEGGAESRVGRLLLMMIAGGILLCLAVIVVISTSNRRIVYQPVMQSDLGFTVNDDYYSVVNKLGQPAEDKWKSDQGELQYRRMSYPKQGLSIILMGSDRKDIHYLGAMDKDWRVVHSINKNAEAMLRSLKRF